MRPVQFTSDSVEELVAFAMSVHNAVRRMPVAVKARHSPGVLIEDGEFILSARECRSLECMFTGDHVRQIHIDRGKYLGTIMFASAIVDHLSRRIAAIGIIDTLGMLSLNGFAADRQEIDRQLGGRSREDNTSSATADN